MGYSKDLLICWCETSINNASSPHTARLFESVKAQIEKSSKKQLTWLSRELSRQNVTTQSAFEVYIILSFLTRND